MGGCSSKPQTAECHEVSLFHTALKTSDSSAHQTLESLFNQHGRDGEDLLEDAQTLHELLLHVVESKELPQSAGVMALTTENAENCTQTKQNGSMSNLIENDQEKGAAKLEDSLPGTLAAVATDENCKKAEVTPLDSPEKVAENCIEGYGANISNVAEENHEKAGISKVFVPDSAEVKPQAEDCGQTLHELLLHAVESKELPQSAGVMALTTENAENCAQTKQDGSMSNLIENDQEKGAAKLEDYLPGTLAAVATDENCRKAEVTPLDSPEKVAENRIEGYGANISNVAEENHEKAGILKVFVPDLAEVKPQAEDCVLSKFAEENAIKLECGSLNLEPKSDLQEISVSALPGWAEHETQGLNLEPKLDYLKNLEPNLLESLPTNDLQKIEAPESMESKEADPQALNEVATKGAIKRDEMATETSKVPRPDEKCEKNEKALQGEEVEEQSGKAMEGEKTEEDKKTEMQCAKEALGMDTDRHDGEKEELLNEKAMEAEPPKIQFENGQKLSDQGKKAMEENTLSEITEEAMDCGQEDMQDEKAEEASRKAGVQGEESMREDEKTGVQNERGFDGEVEKLQREEDEKAVHNMENLAGNAQGEGKTGVQKEKDLDGEVEKLRRAEDGKAGDEDGKAVHTEKLAVAQGEEITVGAGAQHCEAEKLDDKNDAKVTGPEESMIELAMTEKGDDKSASDPLGAKEEKKAVEPLEEHSMHEAGDLSAAEKSCMECVESKPNQKKPTEEVIDDANEIAHMEASKQCSNDKGEDPKVME